MDREVSPFSISRRRYSPSWCGLVIALAVIFKINNFNWTRQDIRCAHRAHIAGRIVDGTAPKAVRLVPLGFALAVHIKSIT